VLVFRAPLIASEWTSRQRGCCAKVKNLAAEHDVDSLGMSIRCVLHKSVALKLKRLGKATHNSVHHSAA
jgi:hypothetical protein